MSRSMKDNRVEKDVEEVDEEGTEKQMERAWKRKRWIRNWSTPTRKGERKICRMAGKKQIARRRRNCRKEYRRMVGTQRLARQMWTL